MPSWVTPGVAAELWQISLEQVMSDIAAGRVRSRSEGGFVFVDMDPSSGAPEIQQYNARPAQYRRSLAWTMPAAQPLVTQAERDALLDEAAPEQSAFSHEPPCEDPPAPMTLSEDDIPNWNEVRARVGRSRRPPLRQAA